MKPYYDENGITLYHGDCLDVLPHVGAPDLIFTSPPYNLGVSTGGGFAAPGKKTGLWSGGPLAHGYEGHEDNMPWTEYVEWQQAVLRACWAQISARGAIFYNHKPRVQAGALVTPLALNPGLPVRQIVIWDRGSGMNFAPTHYVPSHEWIVVFARPEFRLKSKGASGLGDVWRVPPETGSDHPAPFPIALPGRAIESIAPELVVDPFAGSGSTLRAAKDAGVRAIGIEKNERYCEMAVKRLAQMSLFEAAA
jgi:DNA modification methylase